jgi:hypothetical protein
MHFHIVKMYKDKEVKNVKNFFANLFIALVLVGKTNTCLDWLELWIIIYYAICVANHLSCGLDSWPWQGIFLYSFRFLLMVGICDTYKFSQWLVKLIYGCLCAITLIYIMSEWPITVQYMYGSGFQMSTASPSIWYI